MRNSFFLSVGDQNQIVCDIIVSVFAYLYLPYLHFWCQAIIKLVL